MQHRYTALAVLLTLVAGCGEQKQNDPPSAPTTHERIEQLRSLPYTGGTTAAEDEPTGVILFDEARSSQGYRLYTVALLGRAELITRDGDVARRWEQPGDRWEHAELLPDGALLVVGIEDLGWHYGKTTQTSIPDSSRYVMKLDWSGKQLWKRKYLAHHDIEVTPDGNLLLLTFERRTAPANHLSADIRDDHLTLLDQAGNLLTSRSMLDAVNNEPDVILLELVQPSERGLRPWVDLFHSNSLEWIRHEELFSRDSIYGPDKILVSMRHQDRVAIYDWQEEKFVWSWGQREISGPHDAHMLENGNVLLFDNGISRNWSRAVELDPLSRRVVWTYESDPRQSFYTASRGSVQRLPNGNTLLAESDRGRAIEVSSDGETVWEFICPYHAGKHERASIVRMVQYSKEFVDRLLMTNE